MRIARFDRVPSPFSLALLAFVTALAFLVGNRLVEPDARPFNSGSLAPGERAISATDDQVWSLRQRIRQEPRDVDAYGLLAYAYLQKARETGDPAYYTRAAEIINRGLALDPRHIELLIGQGTLALARHEFRAALQLGEQARALNPDIPRVYGIIGDAQIELGQYDEAVQTIQTMVDMRPDLSSYSRAAYLKELHGKLPGAIAVMQLAVASGAANAENKQWVRVQLGNLYFSQGTLDEAEHAYRQALAGLPGYVPALAGLARVETARGRYDTAIDLYTQATQRMPLPEYVIALGDVYAAVGNLQQAQRQYDLVEAIDGLMKQNGVNTDLEIALFYADHELDLPATLAKAQAAYAARPSIHAADVLAWTLYKTGDYAEASHYAAEALRLGTQDALMFFHAGMIARAQGQDGSARRLLRQALDLNPHFSVRWSELATTTLEQLDSDATSMEKRR